MRNLIKGNMIRSGTLLWVTALAALFYLLSSSLYVATALAELTFSPDVTVVLDGETVNDEDAAADDLAGTITLIDVGNIPGATDVNAYHRLPNGEELISFDTTVDLGGLTVAPGDIVRYDGSNYILEFDASAHGVPSGVLTDAISVANGDLLLSFDTTVALPGNLTVDDEDVVGFDGTDFSLFFDGSDAGITPSLDLDGVHYLGNDRLLLSLDGSGTVDGVSFDDEDVLEHNLTGGTWELSYDGSAQHAEWSPADLDAVHSVAILIVNVDIKPGSDPNSINLKSKGVVPVAILTVEDFDATTVNPLSVEFGPDGAMEAHGRGHIEDVDGDSDLDLVLHFKTQETGIMCGDSSASLTGETFGGQAIEGSDSIKTVKCE